MSPVLAIALGFAIGWGVYEVACLILGLVYGRNRKGSQ